MAQSPLKMLLVEDSEDDAFLLYAELSHAGKGVKYRRVESAAAMRAALAESDWDMVISDHAMPEFSSLDALRVLQGSGLDIPFIVYSGTIPEQMAISALQAGVQDCVQKGNLPRLVSTIERELENAATRRAKTQAELHVHRLAYYDDLTGLPNRNYFCEQVQQALKRKPQSAALLFVDLNRFMRLNNTFGYSVGDAVMRLIAERLAQCVADKGLLARFRGDEFGIYLECDDSTQVNALAEEICAAFTPPFVHDNLEFYITVSIGVSSFPGDRHEVQALLMNAASAMTLTKDLWRSNYTCYAKEMGDSSARKIVLEAALRHAVERDELFLQFQPIVELEGDGIAGCEALVRWRHPELGVISPDKFIPLADESGFIIELGAWVLRQACDQIKRLHDAGYDWLTLSVNVSAVQFAQPQLVAQISSVLAATGLAAQFLTVEITESVLMEDAELAIGTLRALKEQGIKIAVDDFGTGYSSLAYLKRFSIDVLKIDKSFINDVSIDADSAAIVSAIAVLAKSLKLDVVAEGVETREQLEMVRRIGCDRMQGYFFSRPLDIDKLSQLIAERHPLRIAMGSPFQPGQRMLLA